MQKHLKINKEPDKQLTGLNGRLKALDKSDYLAKRVDMVANDFKIHSSFDGDFIMQGASPRQSISIYKMPKQQ